MFNETNANLTSAANVTGALNQTYINGTLVASSTSLNSTVNGINQTMQSQQIQVATKNVINSLGKSLGKLTNGIYNQWEYFWNGAPPKVSLKTRQEIAAARVQQKQLEQRQEARTQFEATLYSTVEDALNRQVTLGQATAEMAKLLNSQPEENLREDLNWTLQVLKNNFPEQGKRLENTLKIALALEQLKSNWTDATIAQALDQVVAYLQSDSSGDPVRAFDSIIITFRKSFDEAKSTLLESALIEKLKEENQKDTFKHKRTVQETQSSYTLSQKVALNGTWDRLTLCAYNLRAMLFGATNTTQEAKVLDVQAGGIQLDEGASAAISSSFGPRKGKNHVSSACGDHGIFHLTTLDEQQGAYPIFYRTVISNNSLVRPQEPADYYTSDAPKKAPRTAHLGEYKSITPYTYWVTYSLDGVDYTEGNLAGFNTNSSGHLQREASGAYVSPFYLTNSFPWPRNESENKFMQEVFSFADGIAKVLLKMPLGLEEVTFNQTLNEVDFQPTTHSSPEIFNQLREVPIASRTPLATGTKFTTLISQLTNGSTALYTYDLDTKTFASARILPDGLRSPVSNATMNIVDCPTEPGTYVYIREVEGAMKYDVVNATRGSSSLIGGEQEYTDYNTSVRPQPNVGCFSDNKIIFAFLDNGQPSYVTLTINPPPIAAPPSTPPLNSPISAPASTPPLSAPASAPVAVPNSAPSNGIQIIVNIPPNLDKTPVPITENGIVVSNSTVTISVTDKNGFTIVFTNNGTDVPEGKFFPVTVFKDGTISWGRGTATEGTVPQFTGCNAENECTPSQPGTPLQTLFTAGPLDWRIILGVVLGAVGVVGIAGTTFYCKFFKPQYDQKRRRDEELAHAERTASIDLSSSSSGEQSQPITKWAPRSPSYDSTSTTEQQTVDV